MMPNIVRGGKMAGLMNYLVGPGRANEHVNPRVIAGDDTILFAAPEGVELSRDDALDIANALERPRMAFGTKVTKPVTKYNPETQKRETVGRTDAHVWHCSLSLGPQDEKLTDEAWNRIATDFVDRMGFVDPDRAKSSRWVAIHHGLSKNGNDHIHLVVQMVTEDGSKQRVHGDFKKAQKVCNDLEHEYGLTVVEGRETGQTLAAEKPGERHRQAREDAPWVERHELKRRLRSALASSTSEAQFVQRVFAAGVLIRPRFAQGTRDVIVGYKIALPCPANADREPIYYAPSKLDANLSLPAIRRALGVSEKSGDPKAVGTWQEFHASTRTPKNPRATGVSSDLRAKTRDGEVSIYQLSSIFAAGSMKYETDRPGPMAKASEDLAQIARNPQSYGYLTRLMQRAGSKDATEGWIALLLQASRVSRAMASSNFAGHRPQLASTHTGTLVDVESALSRVYSMKTQTTTDPAHSSTQTVDRLRQAQGIHGAPRPFGTPATPSTETDSTSTHDRGRGRDV